MFDLQPPRHISTLRRTPVWSRAAVASAETPIKPNRATTREQGGRKASPRRSSALGFVADSPLEGAGFEPSVPRLGWAQLPYAGQSEDVARTNLEVLDLRKRLRERDGLSAAGIRTLGRS